MTGVQTWALPIWPDTLTVTSTDTNSVADVDTVAITVLAFDYPPVNTVPGAQVVNEDTALTVGGISVTDVDGNLSTVQLAVANGTVTRSEERRVGKGGGGRGTATGTSGGNQEKMNGA